METSFMKTGFLICLLAPLLVLGQGKQARTDSLLVRLTDSLAYTNQIHGPYVGFSGKRTTQYKRFEKLMELSDCPDLLEFCNHPSAVVRGYAFWGLARKQYPGLDSVLIAHAQDETPVVEIQGGVMNQIPLVRFMLWVVDPDMMDAESRKLDPAVFQKITELRFSRD